MKITPGFVEGIRHLISGARAAAARGVNLVQVHTNFEIGRRIVEEEQRGKNRAAYGEEIVKVLAKRLTADFGRGFSASNLAAMRSFYLLYQDRIPIFQSTIGKSPISRKPAQALAQPEAAEIFQSAIGKSGSAPRPFQLSWTHYFFLIGIKNPDERSFYEIESGAQNWTVRELRRQFDSGLYERLALSRDKNGIRRLARNGHTVEHPRDLLKEPLVLEFLGLDEQTRYSESDLESAIITRIEHFLLELGKGFLFDLKIGKLTHQDLGQMQMYVNYFDRSVKTAEENSTIGIILCKQKNEALVEITLPKDANIHAREHQLYLPSKDELQQKLMEWVGEGVAER